MSTSVEQISHLETVKVSSQISRGCSCTRSILRRMMDDLMQNHVRGGVRDLTKRAQKTSSHTDIVKVTHLTLE